MTPPEGGTTPPFNGHQSGGSGYPDATRERSQDPFLLDSPSEGPGKVLRLGKQREIPQQEPSSEGLPVKAT